MLKLASAALVAVLPVSSRAAPAAVADISVSTRSVKTAPIEFHFDNRVIDPVHGRTTVGASGGFKEGKPLEVLVWGSGGAIAGSLAGPIGAAIGGGVGALCGLVYSKFVVPHNGPDSAKR